jgi:hypothetical protein
MKSGDVRIIALADDGQSFMFCQEKKVADPLLRQMWITLTPEVVPDIEGIDMLTGTKQGFFGPTKPNNTVGASRSNFCMGFVERIN